MNDLNNETDEKETLSEVSKIKNSFSENSNHNHNLDNCLSSRENSIRLKNDDQFNTILSHSSTNKTNDNDNLSTSEIKLKKIQEEINSKNLVISSLDSRLNKLHRYHKYYFSQKKKKIPSINDNEKIISKLKSKNNELISTLSNLSNKLKTLEVDTCCFDTIQANNRKSKLKSIKTERQSIQNKISEIDSQINNILSENKMNKNSRRKLINDYDTQIRHNIIIDSSPKKIERRNYPYFGDSDNIYRSIRSLEFQYSKEEEKKELKEKQLKYKEMRDRELEIVHLRKMKIGNRELEIQNYRNKKYIPKKDYISSEERELKRKVE